MNPYVPAPRQDGSHAATAKRLGTSGDGRSSPHPGLDPAVLARTMDAVIADAQRAMKANQDRNDVVRVAMALRQIAEVEFYSLGLENQLPLAWAEHYEVARRQIERETDPEYQQYLELRRLFEPGQDPR